MLALKEFTISFRKYMYMYIHTHTHTHTHTWEKMILPSIDKGSKLA